MKYKIAICDDEISDIHILERHLVNYQMMNDVDFDISTYTSSSEFVAKYNQQGLFDLLFLDVEMPEINGIEVAEKIRALPDRNLQIIYISYYPGYMRDSFHVHAYNYLEKPITTQALYPAIDQFLREQYNNTSTKLSISAKESVFLVDTNDIISVRVKKKESKTVIFQLSSRTLETAAYLKDYEDFLTENGFVYVYRGIMVNSQFIYQIEQNEIHLINGETYPLSRRYERKLRELYVKHIIKTLR